MRELVATGVAPHYAELAPQLGISPSESLRRIGRIVELTPGWMHPGTDYIASFSPFNNQPTPYRVAVAVENVGLPNVVSKRWRAAGFPGKGCTY